MNCISFITERIGGDTKISASRVTDLKVRFSLVCGTGLGNYEFLHASDGALLTVDGGYIMVKKRH